jgi:hypothetical protein
MYADQRAGEAEPRCASLIHTACARQRWQVRCGEPNAGDSDEPGDSYDDPKLTSSQVHGEPAEGYE